MSAQVLPSPIDPAFLSRLDDDFVEYYNRNLAIKPATHNIAIEHIRAAPEKFASPWYRDFTYEPFVKDIKLKAEDGHEFTVRCYHPDPRTSPFGDGPYPIHINFHGNGIVSKLRKANRKLIAYLGGGFVLGGLTGDAELCMLMRNRVGIIVMDVDYRLSPGENGLV